LELYNPTDEDVALVDYAIARVSNAPSVPGDYEEWEVFAATDTIRANSTFLWMNPGAVDSLLSIADATGSAFFNGDDAVALVFGSEDNYQVLDMFGDFFGDPGTGWDVAGISAATANRVLIRKSVVKEGNPAPQGSFGTDATTSEWIVGEDGANDFSNAGMHMIDNSIMLTILHNNDGESQLIALNSDESDTLYNFGGVARFKTVVDNLRDEATYPGSAAILLSSGDNFLAGPEFNAGVNDGIYYDALALEALGYDAIAIGNHDFDFGPQTLADFINEFGDFAPPYVSANLDFTNEPSLKALADSGRIVSSTIVEAGNQYIGIVGATTDNLPFISSPGNVIVSNQIATLVQAEIDALEAEGINKIVLISHLQGIEEDSVLATQLSGIDVMIAGGGDELLANDGDLLVPGDEGQVYGDYPLLVDNLDGDEIPIVTTKGSYGYVGKLVIEFDAAGDIVDVTDDSGPVRVSGVGIDAAVADAELQAEVVDPVVEYLEDLAANVIAETTVPLNGVRGSVRSTETNLGNVIADAFLHVAQDRAASFGANVPDVALQNGGGIRNDDIIDVGDMTELLTFDVLPFGNFLSVVEDLSAATMKDIVENMLAALDSDNNATGSGTGRFGQPAGFSFTYDPTAPGRTFDENDNVVNPGERVIDIVLEDGTYLVRDGEVLQDAPTVSLATGSFTAGGGDQYPFGDADVVQLGITDQQTLALYLSDSEYLDGTVEADDYPEGGLGRINYLGTTIGDIFSKIDGVRVTTEGVVTRAAGRIARIQDDTGAIAVFNSSGAFRDSVEAGAIKAGDLIRVTGEISPFAGLQEIAGDLKFEVLSRLNPLPPAIPVTLAEIAANGEAYESKLIAVSGLTIDSDEEVFSASTTYDISDASGETEVALRIQSSSDASNVIGQPIPDGEFYFIGVLSQFDFSEEAGYQLNPVDSTDISTGFTIALLHNNDGESQLVNLGSGSEDFGGVARFKSLVDQQRNMNESMGRGVLMLSSGDNFLAGPEYTVGVNDSVFYDALAIDAIGYDALSLGNHDFDFGPQVAFDFINQIESVFLSANLDFSANDSLSKLESEGKIAAGEIFEINGQSVGVVGAITPNLPFISSPGDVEVGSDVATAVQNVVDNMELLGVNKIILISHLQGVEEDSLLATQLSGVDIMIAGGGDDLLANEGDVLIPGDEAEASYPIFAPDADDVQIPIVSTAGNYAYLGQLVVNFDAEGNVIDILDESGPIRVAGGSNPDAVPADPYLQEFVVDPVEEGLSVLNSNVIATSDVVLQGDSDNVRSKETNTGNIVTDAYLWQAALLADEFGAPVPTIAIANGGGIRNGEIPAGNITELNTFDILSFLNFLTVVENITPEQLKLILENAVSRIVLVDGVPTRQGDGTGRYAQVAGFSFTYNASLEPLEYNDEGNITFEGRRIIDVSLDDGTPIIEKGQVVDGAPTLNLATADFTARGGDQYPFDESNDLTLLGVTYQQTLYNYLVASTEDGGLNGQITAAQYPVDGEGRIALTSELPVNIEPSESGLPTVFALQQNYPNPFNPSTNIQFDLPENANVNLTVFNMLGQKVMTLVDRRMEAGYHSVVFDARSLASGMYIYRIQAGSYISTKKMMLIK
ncbi:MAG: 5'-nucleotidase C-terminal domain-containing protein, partial [Balneolales bacterium]|nr:5'-nucleotidase C-terminal domain-containing protein [Balneolales bacterium]